MPATTACAVDVVAPALIGAGYTPFNAANARLGVGDSATAFAVGQTDLQGTSKLRKAMDSTYPQNSSGTLAFRSTFSEAEANWQWREWGVFNAASAGTMLSRKVQDLGLKPNTEQWRLTVSILIAGG